MSTFTIGEVAQRTGFSPSALRYYEGIGLVTPTERTPAGYRVYDERTLSQLAFISRAKQLGCSLEEITDLVQIWDDDRCGPVQRRFHDLVTAKLAEARRQVVELNTFSTQLQAAMAQLSGPATDGACGDDCACLAETTPSNPAIPVILSRKDGRTAIGEPPPIACTLDLGSMPDRLGEWSQLLTHTTSRRTNPDASLRLEFRADVPLDELTRLLAAEQHCCAFFTFVLTIDVRGIALDVRVPEGAEAIANALFGEAA